MRRENQIDVRLAGLTPQLDKRLVLGCWFGRQYVDAGGGDFPGTQASASAAVSTTAPREVLTRIESGFICASVSVLIRRSVCSVNGVCGRTTSLVEQFLKRNHLYPKTFSVPGRRYGSWAMTRIRMALARCAVA